MTGKFYVYAHARLSDGEIFYIGKGCRRRAQARYGRSKMWHRVVEKHGLSVSFIHINLGEDQAFLLERQEIRDRRPMCNFTEGGEGISGYRHTGETRAIISAAHTGRTQCPETVARRAAALRGKKRTPEHCAKHGDIMRGRNHTAETRAKMSAAHKGKARSPEAVAKVAEWHRGRKRDATARQNMSDAQPARAVQCVETGIIFPSLVASAHWLREHGYPKATKAGVWFAASGRRERSYGYRWKYVNDSDT